MFNFENVYGYDYFDKCLKRLYELRHISSREKHGFIKLISKLDFGNMFIEKDEVFEVKFNKKVLEVKEIGLYLFLVILRNDKGIITQRLYQYLKTEGNLDNVLISTTYLNKDLLIKVLKITVPYDILVEKAIERLNELEDVDLLNDQTILSINGGPELTVGDLIVENRENVIIVFMSGCTHCMYTQCKINQPNINEIKEEREMVDTRNVKLKDVVKSLDILTNLKNIINPINMLDPKEKVSITLSDSEYQLEIIPEEQNSGMFKINVFGNSSLQLQTWDSHSFCNGLTHQIPLISILFNTKHSDIDKLQEFITNSLSMLK